MPDLTSVGAAVARTVKALRGARGWSLDALSTRSGVSKGVLVTLEQGRSNPNLLTLIRLAEAFSVPITRLVQLDEEPAVQLAGPERAVVLWEGPSGGRGTLLIGTDPPQALELWRWSLEPGESYGAEAHSPGTREVVSVDQGTLTLSVDESDHRVGPGASASFAGDRPHRYENRGRTTVRFAMVVTVPPADREGGAPAGAP